MVKVNSKEFFSLLLDHCVHVESNETLNFVASLVNKVVGIIARTHC